MSTRGATLQDVGFIHASREHQVPIVAAAVYADYPGPLLVLGIDEAALAAAGIEVRVESAPGTQEKFPHIYGPLPISAVVDMRDLRR